MVSTVASNYNLDPLVRQGEVLGIDIASPSRPQPLQATRVMDGVPIIDWTKLIPDLEYGGVDNLRSSIVRDECIEPDQRALQGF